MLNVVVSRNFFVKSFHTKIGCRMPALPRNPSSMTKERLAEELRRNNISLPSARSRKEVYVELYKRHLLDNSPQLTAYRDMSVNTSPKIGFSSDEEDDDVEIQKKTPKPALNANNNRSQRKASRKSDKTLFEDRLAEVEELSNADLRKELQSKGVKAGPIIASTRSVYERKLADVLIGQEKEEEQQENAESSEEMENGYSDSDVDENDPDAVTPEEPQEQPVEQVESTRTSSYRSQRTQVVNREYSTRQRSNIQQSQVETVLPEKTEEATKTSNEKTAERSKPLVPIWLQLIIFAIIAAFLVLIWYNMETGQTDPTLLT